MLLNEGAKTTKSELLPKRLTNLDKRSREYLLPEEVDRLIAASKRVTRNALRDSTLILLSYRHGLRVSEAIALTWSDVDFGGSIHINRLKKGKSGRHPIRKPEFVALHKLKKEQKIRTPYLFISQQNTPLSDRLVRNIISKAGKLAQLPFSVHPHMLRHACGYYLANKGFDTRAIAEYLGHSSLEHTYRYTAIAPGRFNDFWDD